MYLYQSKGAEESNKKGATTSLLEQGIGLACARRGIKNHDESTICGQERKGIDSKLEGQYKNGED